MYLPIVLSLLLLGAHFLRDDVTPLVVVAIALCGLLFVRRPWAARTTQLALLAGGVEWLRTLMTLVLQRQHAGLPWLRMALILGAVTALAWLAAWLFQTARLGRIYRLREERAVGD
jgi:presenilin-like A22 family membrane protease